MWQTFVSLMIVLTMTMMLHVASSVSPSLAESSTGDQAVTGITEAAIASRLSSDINSMYVAATDDFNALRGPKNTRESTADETWYRSARQYFGIVSGQGSGCSVIVYADHSDDTLLCDLRQVDDTKRTELFGSILSAIQNRLGNDWTYADSEIDSGVHKGPGDLRAFTAEKEGSPRFSLTMTKYDVIVEVRAVPPAT
jgi:hypothetical protein